jgi:hypothetical protein
MKFLNSDGLKRTLEQLGTYINTVVNQMWMTIYADYTKQFSKVNLQLDAKADKTTTYEAIGLKANKTDVDSAVNDVNGRLDTLLNSEGTAGVIDTFKDVETFLSGFSDSEAEGLKSQLDLKADKTDLEALQQDVEDNVQTKLDALTETVDTKTDYSDFKELKKRVKEVEEAAESTSNSLDALVSGTGVEGVIDTFKDVENFLQGFSDSETEGLKNQLELKADVTALQELQSYAETKADDSELKYVAGELSSVIDNYVSTKKQTFTSSQQQIASNNIGLIQVGADGSNIPQCFIDEWNAVCKYRAGQLGTYNSKTGYFELNGITDIPYSEAVEIMALNKRSYARANNCETSYYHFGSENNTCRTMLPIYVTIGVDMNFSSSFSGWPNLEVIQFTSYADILSLSNFDRTFHSDSKLREVRGVFNVRNAIINDGFYGCKSLEEVRMSGLNQSAGFGYSPKLSYDSLKWLIDKAVNSTDITVYVHADVYAKLTDESNTTWYALFDQALNRKIAFATIS